MNSEEDRGDNLHCEGKLLGAQGYHWVGHAVVAGIGIHLGDRARNLLLPEGVKCEDLINGTVNCLVTILAAANFLWDLVPGFSLLKHSSAKE